MTSLLVQIVTALVHVRVSRMDSDWCILDSLVAL
jgi:hypothetical protein